MDKQLSFQSCIKICLINLEEKKKKKKINNYFRGKKIFSACSTS